MLRPFGFGPSRLNRRLCQACFRSVDKKPGGAEIELSLLFADVRGSTGLAEHMPAHEFSQLVSRFYGTAARVVDAWDGIVDKFVGDEVVALFVPGFAGEAHAERAVSAAKELLLETRNADGAPWIPIGVGLHTGVAYVGRVGEGDACDFTAVGDAVNTTARLASSAAAGEILVSRVAANAAGLDPGQLEARTLSLRGRDGRSTRSSRPSRPLCLRARDEGWDDNHHAFPALARHGLGRFQLDVSWWVIRRSSARGSFGTSGLRRELSSSAVVCFRVRADEAPQLLLDELRPTIGLRQRNEPPPG